MLALFDNEHVWIRTQPGSQAAKFDLAADLAASKHRGSLGDLAKVDELIGEADLFVDLKRSSLYADSLRVRRGRFLFVDDNEIDAVADQLTRQCKAGWARSDN